MTADGFDVVRISDLLSAGSTEMSHPTDLDKSLSERGLDRRVGSLVTGVCAAHRYIIVQLRSDAEYPIMRS